MKNRILAVGVLLSVLLALSLTSAQAGEIAAPSPAVVNLEQVLEGKPTASVNAGGGVTLGLATADGRFGQDLTIMADGRQVQKLAGGRFMACARLEAGSITYWGISEFTGGAHCCGQFAFLARAAAGQPVRYLGQTVGYNGGPRDFPGSFIARQGQLYFESFDNRFDYFHTSHADSLLVNVPETYYRLTPAAITVDNLPFKDVYVKEAAAVNQTIRRQATHQNGKAKAILRPGFSPGFENLMFSDTLGQLLVKRTILYLYAREDKLAWDTFRRDVSRYYLTSAWVPQLQREILKTLGASPY
ncbi:MAG: hypothetical protein L6277_11420 [Desulfobacterales bacterium]|nr:hypothetical protein [Pseudomonadota bacterium]MBU4355643.1 hypothetical protein [Pseudomonadota bacterium]MCG2772681.1 hypothetical protein [Desulfobacterales bacterium]